ncbi:hypothetical protein B0O99DRAFT_602634 [Bisporella sp. PMI_857]|nr:hypothetical protein B0O99DRAFT_602634 [Bisporella sp. PMI_857]
MRFPFKKTRATGMYLLPLTSSLSQAKASTLPLKMDRLLETYRYAEPITANQIENNTNFLNMSQIWAENNTDPLVIAAHVPEPVKCDTPEECWEKYRIIGPKEAWVKNAENVLKSSVLTDWDDWYKEYETNDRWDCHKLEFAPLQCYASHFWGDSNFKCRLDQLGRCAIPSAEVVLSNIDKRFPNLTIKEKVETAIGVYFTMKNFETVALNHKSLYDLLNEMKIEFGLKARSLVEAFTPQKDYIQAAKCQLAENLVRLTVALGFQIANTALSAASKFVDIKMLTDEALSILGDMGISSNIQEFFINNAKTWADSGEHIHNIIMNRKNARQPAANPWQGQAEMLKLSVTTVKGMCGNQFGVGNDDNAVRTDELQRFVLDHFNANQEKLIYNFEAMMHYNKEHGGKSPILNLYMSADQWPVSASQAEKSLSLVKGEAKQAATNLFASELWAGSRCYLDCETRRDGNDPYSEVCSGTQPNDVRRYKKPQLNYVSRLCDPNLQVRCQMQCLTKQERNNVKIPLYGLDRLEEFGINSTALLGNSWNAWKEMGINSFEAMDILPRNGILETAYDALRLPVCMPFKGQKRISELGKHKTQKGLILPHEVEKWSDGMPVSCGFRSEETSRFHNRIGLDVAEEEREYRRYHVARELSKLDPVEGYLMLCELNLDWPKSAKTYNDGDLMYRLKEYRRDKYCDAVKRDTWYMNNFEANAYFCKYEPGLTAYFKNAEKDHIDGYKKLVYNHWRRCTRLRTGWIDRNKKNFSPQLENAIRNSVANARRDRPTDDWHSAQSVKNWKHEELTGAKAFGVNNGPV